MTLSCILASCVMALSSCSSFETISETAHHPTTGEQETKQVNGSSVIHREGYLSSGYLRRALSQFGTQKTGGEFLKIAKIDNNSSQLAGFEALAITDKGEVLLIHRSGRLVPIPIGAPSVQAGDYSPVTSKVALAGPEGVHLYDLNSGLEVAQLTKLRARINSIDFDGSGEGVLMGTTDNKVYRWRYQNERELSSLREQEQALERYVGHASVISQVAFHPKGRVFFSADWTGKVLAWVRYDADGFEGEYLTNAVSGRPFTAEVRLAKASFQADGAVEALRVGDSGELLAIGSDKGQLALIMVRGFRLLAKTQAHDGLMYDLDFSKDSTMTATIGRDGRLKIWKITDLDLDSIDPTKASWQLVFETEVIGARKVVIMDQNRVLIGLKSGEVRFVSIQPQSVILDNAPVLRH